MKKYLTLLILVCLTAFSCQKEPVVETLQNNTKVWLRLKVPDMPQTTRAVGSVDGSQAESSTIKDFNIFVWNHANAYHEYFTDVSTPILSILIGQYNVVVIANAGKKLNVLDYEALPQTSLADLGIDTYNNAIMTYSGRINAVNGAAIPIPLDRAYAYTGFNFQIADVFPECTLISYRLCNIPTTTTVITPQAGTYTPAELCTTTTQNYNLGDSKTANDGTYVFENIRPDEPSITAPQQRTKANAPRGAMYMELCCRMNSGELLTYCIYLGEGSPSSFTVRRNVRSYYNITVFSKNDARVTTVKVENTTTSYIICPHPEGAYYPLGEIRYTGSETDAVVGRCIPSLTFAPIPTGLVLQRKNGDTWVNDTTPPTPLQAAGLEAVAEYRAYIPTSTLRSSSEIQYARAAQYLTTETDATTIWSDTQTTHFGFQATLDCAAGFTTKLAAQDTAVQWAEQSDGTKKLVIDTDATNNTALFEIQGTDVSAFSGIKDEGGAVVSFEVVKTPTQITGKFPVTHTQVYTTAWAPVTLLCKETNKNQVYMLNKNQLTISGITADVLLEIQYDVADDMLFSDRHITPTVVGSTETKTIPLYVRNGATQLIDLLFYPQRPGSVSYTIHLKDTNGLELTAKTISATIAPVTVKFEITLKYDALQNISSIATYYRDAVAVVNTSPQLEHVKGDRTLAQITFRPLGFEVSQVNMGNDDPYCTWWSLKPLTPYENYIYIPEIWMVPSSIIQSQKTYILWSEYDIDAIDSRFERTGFLPTLGTLDGTVSVYDTDILRRSFVRVLFPAVKDSHCVKITYNTLPGLTFESNYTYTNRL